MSVAPERSDALTLTFLVAPLRRASCSCTAFPTPRRISAGSRVKDLAVTGGRSLWRLMEKESHHHFATCESSVSCIACETSSRLSGDRDAMAAWISISEVNATTVWGVIEALWEMRQQDLQDDLFADVIESDGSGELLTLMPVLERLAHDFAITRLPVGDHPMKHMRARRPIFTNGRVRHFCCSRIQRSEGADFSSHRAVRRPWASMRRDEVCEAGVECMQAADLAYLRGRGTSLGGIRPKCTVVDEDGASPLASFPVCRMNAP